MLCECVDSYTKDFIGEVLKRFWRQSEKPFDHTIEKQLTHELLCFVDKDCLVLGEDYEEEVKDLIEHGNNLIRRKKCLNM